MITCIEIVKIYAFKLNIHFFILDWLAIHNKKSFLPKTVKQEILSVLRKTNIYEELWKIAFLECQKKVDEEILESCYHMFLETEIED